MKASELREYTTEELRSLLKDLRMQLQELKMKNRVEGIDNPLRIRMMKRDIARVLTILTERNPNPNKKKNRKKKLTAKNK